MMTCPTGNYHLDLLILRFKEDERKHRFSIIPITKEEVEEEKYRIYLDQNRESKKVIEAKWRTLNNQRQETENRQEDEEDQIEIRGHLRHRRHR